MLSVYCLWIKIRQNVFYLFIFLPFYLLVNELAPLLRPHEIHPRTDGIPSDKQVEVRAALRQPTVSILRIQHVLSTLVVLHTLCAEQSVQFLRRHAQLLGYLRGGVAGYTVQHIVSVESLRQQAVDFRLLLGNELLLLSDEGILLLERLAKHFLGTAADVLVSVALMERNEAASLANLRQHHSSNPMLELLGGVEFRAEYQGIETALRNEEYTAILHHRLATSKPLTSDSVFYRVRYINMLVYSICGSAIPQNLAHIFAAEKRLAFAVERDADISELRVVEHHDGSSLIN